MLWKRKSRLPLLSRDGSIKKPHEMHHGGDGTMAINHCHCKIRAYGLCKSHH
jgi:hypothetical protein